MKRRGFTLLELLIVISIIAILASILFPVFARARETARRSSCASNLSQLGGALNMYAQAYDGHFPRKNNSYAALYRYVRNVDIFYCPSDSAERHWIMKTVNSPNIESSYLSSYQVPTQTASSYVIKGGLTNDDRADMIIAGEACAWHGDLVNVLYIGGTVKGILSDSYKPVAKPNPKPEIYTCEPPVPSPPGAPAPSAPPPASPKPIPASPAPGQ